VTRSEQSRIDFVEVVMAIEESFGIEILEVDAGRFGGPCEILDWLELRLIGKPINQRIAPLLAKLAELHRSPELAERLDGTWRPEQIAAVVREILRVHVSDDWSDPPDPDASVLAPLNPNPRPLSGAASVFPNKKQ
jgi:hypothetical protein